MKNQLKSYLASVLAFYSDPKVPLLVKISAVVVFATLTIPVVLFIYGLLVGWEGSYVIAFFLVFFALVGSIVYSFSRFFQWLEDRE